MPLMGRVLLQLHWGFWSRAPIVSARQDTLYVPPPSTLVGAFAAGLARALDALCGRRPPEVLAAGGRLVTFTWLLVKEGVIREVYMRVLDGYGVSWIDPGRVLLAPYVHRENLEDPKLGPRFTWALRYLGKVYAPGLIMEAAYLVDGDALARVASLLGCGATPEELLRAALAAITRLGPVEGVATPLDVSVESVGGPVEVDASGVEAPCPYHRAGGLSGAQGYTIVFFDDWRSPDYWGYWPRGRHGKLAYIVPLPPGLVDKGILMPFTPCNLLYPRRTRGYLLRGLYGGEERVLYPA